MMTLTKLKNQMNEYNVMMQTMSQVLKGMSDATANMGTVISSCSVEG
jgi:hypothetical protein